MIIYLIWGSMQRATILYKPSIYFEIAPYRNGMVSYFLIWA